MFEDGKMYASDNDPIAALSAASYCGLRGEGLLVATNKQTFAVFITYIRQELKN